MKHFVILAFLLIAGYITWHAADKRRRNRFLNWLAPHAVRIGVILLVLLLALGLAVYIPSAGVFF